jgi:hypothetical protein
MNMPTTNEIIEGKVTYTMEDFFQYIKDVSFGIEDIDDKNKERAFNSLFLFIFLSAEDKTLEVMMDVFNQTKENVLEFQDAFKEEIDVCRAIHMKKYLDIFLEYLGTTSITLQILNIWIKDFLKTHIKEEENGTA